MRNSVWLAFALILLVAAIGHAGVYNFVPQPYDFDDLDHNYFYGWKIAWNLPDDEVIVGAHFDISGINNWQYEPNANWLYIHLLDAVPSGGTQIGATVWRWTDSGGGGNNWNGVGTWVATYTDNSTQPEDLSYDFGSLGLLDDLNAYVADGVFGFGLDPDCHFYNCGASFTITTELIPEPSGMLALLTGVIPMAGILTRAARRRTR